MKNLSQKFIGILALVFGMSFTANSQVIGDVYQGGIVFHVDASGLTGLVAAPNDLTGTYQWGCKNIVVLGAEGSAIGTGFQNTIDIIGNDCVTQDGGLTAAEACSEYVVGEYSNWYLPSMDELCSMNSNIGIQSPLENIGNFQSTWYWSSTELNAASAYMNRFSNNSCNTSHVKWNTFLVRPIRSVSFETLGCTDASASNYNSNANTNDGTCISWEEFANQLQSDLDVIVPEDGIGQADVDVAFTDGVSSVDITSDNQDAFDAGVESVVIEECFEFPSQEITLNLPEGWSMFGYTCIDSVDAIDGFIEIADKIDIVKDEMGLSYLPSWGFNALGSLHFSEGYQIKMTEVVTNFQFCSTITLEDGITQTDLDALAASYDGWCLSDTDNDGVCDADEVSGCMDATACNFVADAEFDDSSCYNNDLGCGCDNPAAEEGFDCEGIEAVIVDYEIGDLVEGGIVFYIDETGQHGLVADLQDLGQLTWQEAMDEVLNATSQDYEDWYLPSIEELEVMYNTIGQGADNAGGFGDYYYWSSSESSSENYMNGALGALGVDFGNGYPFDVLIYNAIRVRIIRAF